MPDICNQYYTRKNRVNYYGQKSAAKKRNIEWQFTFESWIEWWINTGYFEQRGVTNDCYQMCRINDIGPYSPNNVYCDTGKNNKESFWKENYKGSKNTKYLINIDGIEYLSVSDAAKAIGFSRSSFYDRYINHISGSQRANKVLPKNVIVTIKKIE